MASHTITFNATEEAIFQKLLTMTGKTEQMAIDDFAKEPLKNQAIQWINDNAKTKLDGLSVADKIAFLEAP